MDLSNLVRRSILWDLLWTVQELLVVDLTEVSSEMYAVHRLILVQSLFYHDTLLNKELVPIEVQMLQLLLR